MEQNKIDINFITIDNREYPQFDFRGHLDDDSAAEAIKRWNDEMTKTKQNRTKISIIYNCIEMTGFDTNARRNWQDIIKMHKDQIEVIWLVSDNIFIRTAAKTMGLISGFPINATKSLSEIKA
jgi:hypothetical protein